MPKTKTKTKNEPTFVFNMLGTSHRKCVCKTHLAKTWLGHWERGTKLRRPQKCCAKHCRRYVEVGAHVRIEGGDQRVPWIVPFCKKHNKRPSSEPIELKPEVMLCGAAKVDCD